MTRIVCLSPGVDLKKLFRHAFKEQAPDLRLLRPEEVQSPGEIKVAMVHAPGEREFEPFPELELICTWGAGVDALLFHPRLPAGAMISRMTDPAQAQMMAATAVFYATGWHRDMFGYPGQQARQQWRERDWTANERFPVGLLGFGRMGAAIARGLVALGYPVSAWGNRARVEDGVEVSSGPDALTSLLQRSRVVICVLPLTEHTRSILNAETLGRMREDALLVQLARGGHLVENDLIPALDAGRPGAAALDVFETEPLPRGHAFWTHPRIIITPHIGSSATPEGVARSVSRAVAAWKAGKRPEGFVDLANGY